MRRFLRRYRTPLCGGALLLLLAATCDGGEDAPAEITPVKKSPQGERGVDAGPAKQTSAPVEEPKQTLTLMDILNPDLSPRCAEIAAPNPPIAAFCQVEMCQEFFRTDPTFSPAEEDLLRSFCAAGRHDVNTVSQRCHFMACRALSGPFPEAGFKELAKPGKGRLHETTQRQLLRGFLRSDERLAWLLTYGADRPESLPHWLPALFGDRIRVKLPWPKTSAAAIFLANKMPQPSPHLNDVARLAGHMDYPNAGETLVGWLLDEKRAPNLRLAASEVLGKQISAGTPLAPKTREVLVARCKMTSFDKIMWATCGPLSHSRTVDPGKLLPGFEQAE